MTRVRLAILLVSMVACLMAACKSSGSNNSTTVETSAKENVNTINTGQQSDEDQIDALSFEPQSQLIISAEFASTVPALAVSTVTVTLDTSSIHLNGEVAVMFPVYNIGGDRYFKLRDLAYMLSGTNKQFAIEWNSESKAIILTSGETYTTVGGEMTVKSGVFKSASRSSSKIFLDGEEVRLSPYHIEGNNYLRLRDIGRIFDFTVEWDGENNTFIVNTETGNTWKYVTVSTPQELFDAIAPETTITIKAGVYDLSAVTETVSQYVTAGSRTAALMVVSVDGLILQAESGADVELVTPDLFSEVMEFSYCSNITLSGIKAGHSVTEKYQCDAGVVRFNDSANIMIDNCMFYGCGSIGIRLWGCIYAQISDTTITDCSLRAVDISRSDHIVFTGCSFIDNRAYGCVIFGNDSFAEFIDCKISGNKSLEWSCVEFTGDVLFERCVFLNNALIGGSEPLFAGSKITLRDCEIEKNNFSAYWNYGVIDLGGNLRK